MKKLTIILLITSLLFVSGCDKQEELETTITDSLSKYSVFFVSHGEDSAPMFFDYKDDNIIVDEKLPSRIDLRENGTVTSVKDQGGFGACWAFSILGTSETSILNELGLTVEEFKNKYGKDLDLSELFHNYFCFKPIEDNDGLTITKIEDEYYIYDAGGNDFYSMSSLSNLYGPNFEEDYPYDGDILFPEDRRNTHEFMLQNYDLLPSTNRLDENGNYVYMKQGTDCIRRALANGDAVTISYCSALSKRNMTYEQAYASVEDYEYGSNEIKELYAKLRSDSVDTNSIDRDTALQLVDFRLAINGFDRDLYKFTDEDTQFILDVLLNPYFGNEQELVFDDVKSGIDHYVINDDTSAQYTYYVADADHEVIIVGYDDNYSKDNFVAEHKPPENGAWICKNSWGPHRYEDGYFYLSYYDQTISSPVVLNYYLNEEEPKNDIDLYAYDLMPISGLGSTVFDNKVSSANVYEIEEDGSLFSLGVNTFNYNTKVDFKVYKLDSDTSKPDKGKLLYSSNQTYEFGGYHTHDIDSDIKVNKGDVISIVISQSADDKYLLVNGYSISKQGYDAIVNEEIDYKPDSLPRKYAESKIFNNQSYIKYNNTWYDYKDIMDVVYNNKQCSYLAYDNPCIKLFVLDN